MQDHWHRLDSATGQWIWTDAYWDWFNNPGSDDDAVIRVGIDKPEPLSFVERHTHGAR